MKSPTTDQSKIQVTTQLFLSGALAKEKFENYLSQEFGDVFIYPWQLYLAQENNELETQYTSKNFDPDIGLYYYNARWYDPELGRFITEDPARDGNNWFIYALNNPLRYLDPTGLEYQSVVYWDLSEERVDFKFWDDDTPQIQFEFSVRVTNNITHRNPDIDPPVKDGTAGDFHYYPSNFPVNTEENPFWLMTGAQFVDDSNFGMTIFTNAERETMGYSVTTEGGEIVDWQEEEMIVETGFLIHEGGWSDGTEPLVQNNIEDATRGCGRAATGTLDNEDPALSMVDLIELTIADGNEIKLYVQE